MFSLPIPDRQSGIAYSDLSYGEIDVGQLVGDLTGDANKANHFAHLDPDLSAETYPRQTGWRGIFGQTGAAQGHLRKQLISVGDIFLFFGLFRHVESVNGRWRFVAHSAPKHVLWGWLQVGGIHQVDELEEENLPWARYHPHFRFDEDNNNILYTAADRCRIDGDDLGLAGAGVFPSIFEGCSLTAPSSSLASYWELPLCFFPEEGKTPLTFHHKSNRWTRLGDRCMLKSAARGQEFVLGLEEYPAVKDWVVKLLQMGAHESVV